MCMLITHQDGKDVKTVLAYTGDLAQFPELDKPVPAKQVNKRMKKLVLHRKTDTASRLGHEAICTRILVGECDEAVTYQGSGSREVIREPVDTAYCIYVQRGHIYLAKLDPTKKPKNGAVNVTFTKTGVFVQLDPVSPAQ